MAFADREKARLAALRDGLFGDAGGGIWGGKAHAHVLSDPLRNLWPGIVDDAAECFARHKIAWHKGAGEAAGGPTGNLLSSQVACVNHLYPLRRRAGVAAALLGGLDPTIVAAEPIEHEGFVAFEFIGSRQHLAERAFIRGAHCTSVDAAIIGLTGDGERRLFLFEWKYAESYGRREKYIPQRANVYDRHITAVGSPFIAIEPRALYFDPFYQLMRQTLLGSLLVAAGELGCRSYRHVHVAPNANVALRHRITAPALSGEDIHAAWRAVLKRPDLFLTRTPEALMAPLEPLDDEHGHRGYLRDRYWAGDPAGEVG